MTTDFEWHRALSQAIEYGFVRREGEQPQPLAAQVVTNSDDQTMLRTLREELRTAREFLFSVAFVSPGAIALLKQEILDFGGSGTIVTSDYLGFNSPAAFRELLALTRFGLSIRLHNDQAFHPKGYLFTHDAHSTAILGSSNLTKTALVSNHEWNLRVAALPESDLQAQLTALRHSQIANSTDLTEAWIDEYERGYVSPATRRRRRIVGDQTRMPDPEWRLSEIVPNEMQLEALAALDQLRRSGEDRGLIISATGTGKTILSALDVRAVNPDRMLFVVHREQILDRAMAEFQMVLGASPDEFGKYAGTVKQMDRRYVFASMDTLSRAENLASVDPTDFEYVLIDEAHRVGAASYRRILEHLRPTFLLGMTATPERTDGYDIFATFNYNVPYEIRLNRALASDMLVPFHYFGVADYTTDTGETSDDFSQLSSLLANTRVDYIVQEIEKYGHAGSPVKGLMFCRNKAEARGLSDELNRRTVHGRVLRTVALTGEDSVATRDDAAARLAAGELDYILTVDVFNEGIDIPAVNQVVMLRQTQSAIVFVQQLGRGLRKAFGKEDLIVIDFIGNYANNYMIPIALFGDSSLNKESLRKNLIGAEEVGVVAGLSSVRFDKIAQERVLSSIVDTKLDSLANLKRAILDLQKRLGRIPSLGDLLEFESADPVVVANAYGSYPALLQRALRIEHGFSEYQLRVLAFLSAEVLAAKREAEAVELCRLLRSEGIDLLSNSSRIVTLDERASVARQLTFEFFTESEQTKYGRPLASRTGQGLQPDADFLAALREDEAFREHVVDLLHTSIEVAQRFRQRPFEPGKQYSRKDACRLLNWRKNITSTIYGYKVDALTATCPIFVTLHKSDEVSASTAYGDRLVDRFSMHWLTRSRRTLQSAEVRSIVEGEVALHVFVKKDDAQGSDFYYLGNASASGATQTSMPDSDGKPLPVVEMTLSWNQPIEAALYDYFQPVLTESAP